MSYTININTADDCGHSGRGRGHRYGRRRGHFHRGQRGHGPYGRGRGGLAGRGELRNVILMLLAEESMHGYQIISTIGERTEEHWTPSPGAIYPRLSMLEDEGLITIATIDERKLATLTDSGKALVEENRAEWDGILDAYLNPEGPDRAHHERRTAMWHLRDVVKRTEEAKNEQVLAILRRAADEIAGL